MAGVNFTNTWGKANLPDASGGPKTLLQIRPAANHRALLHAVTVELFGATGAAAPVEFDIIEQNSDGAGSSAQDATRTKRPPDVGIPETLQTGFTKDHTTEPTNDGDALTAGSLSVHNQSSLRWTPPPGPDGRQRPIHMIGSSKWGLRRRAGSEIYACKITVHVEE